MSLITFDESTVTNEYASEMQSEIPKAITAFNSLVKGSCPSSEMRGWYNWPKNRGFSEAEKIEALKKTLNIDYDLVVVIGIGGSYLGTKAVSESLTHTYNSEMFKKSAQNTYIPIVYAGHNLSEEELLDLLDLLESHKPVINVISKSGTTIEPSIAFRVLFDFINKKFPDEVTRRVIATTDEKKGALREFTEKFKLKSFVVPDDVGGRYSVLTAVGLLPLSLAGYPIEDLLNGAHDFFTALSNTKKEDLVKHDALRYASYRYVAWQKGLKMEILAYKNPKLSALSEWWKQLFGESEGKEGKGLFPASVAYSTDLHSLGQYIQEGDPHFIETFFMIDENVPQKSRKQSIPRTEYNFDGLNDLAGRSIEDINLAAAQAARVSHSGAGTPCATLKFKKVDAKLIGEAIAFFETSCAVGALMLGVDPFNQPGVEVYKKHLRELSGHH